jgi:hypothetical protein
MEVYSQPPSPGRWPPSPQGAMGAVQPSLWSPGLRAGVPGLGATVPGVKVSHRVAWTSSGRPSSLVMVGDSMCHLRSPIREQDPS